MYQTLYEEVRGICRETGYPGDWPRHERCPCCAAPGISYFFKKIGISYWICKACKFVFVNPYPDDSTMDFIYNAGYYPAVRKYVEIPRALGNRANVSESMGSNFYFEIIDLVQRKKPAGKWLDVGGGIGNFLHCVQAQSAGYRVFLNEANREAAEFAARFYHLQVLPAGPEELRKDHAAFDIISMLAVLEHMNKPYDFLKAYLQVLGQEGLLVLNLPNYTRLNRLLSRQHSYVVIPPYHLSLFNSDNIRLLLGRCRELGNIEVHLTGDAAFKCKHLARMGETEDVRIPAPGSGRQELICRGEASPVEEMRFRAWQQLKKLKGSRGYLFFDKKISALLAKWDGTLFMNVTATRTGALSPE